MKVRFTPSAKAQILSAVKYLRQDNPRAALRFRKRTESVLRRLKRCPESGRVIPEFPDLPYRELIIAPYRFFYRAEGKTVWVVAVWYGAQLPGEPSGRKGV